MIIRIIGTNGAGKSHLVRTVMKWYPIGVPLMSSNRNRRRPVGYIMESSEHYRDLFVVGHYLINNGGVDTLHSLEEAYDLIRKFASGNVIYEGKNMSDGAKRTLELHKERLDVRVLLYDTPLEMCINSVRARGHAIAEKTIRKLHDKSRSVAEKLIEAKVPLYLVHRGSAEDMVRGLLSRQAVSRLAGE